MLYPPGLPRRMQAGSSHHARIKNRGTVNLTFVPLPWPWKWSDTKTLWLTGLALAAFLPSSRTGSRDFAGPPSVPPLPPSVLPLRRSRSDGCGSAWKRDPGSGVIGVEKGPLIPVV